VGGAIRRGREEQEVEKDGRNGGRAVAAEGACPTWLERFRQGEDTAKNKITL